MIVYNKFRKVQKEMTVEQFVSSISFRFKKEHNKIFVSPFRWHTRRNAWSTELPFRRWIVYNSGNLRLICLPVFLISCGKFLPRIVYKVSCHSVMNDGCIQETSNKYKPLLSITTWLEKGKYLLAYSWSMGKAEIYAFHVYLTIRHKYLNTWWLEWNCTNIWNVNVVRMSYGSFLSNLHVLQVIGIF